MAIYRFTLDVHTDDAPDGRKMESIAEDLRDYLRAVLCKQYEVTYDKETYGEGTPRWAHIHSSHPDSNGNEGMCRHQTGEATDCEFCHALACDGLDRPIEVA